MTFDYSRLASVNAILNGVSALFLVAGYVAVRRRLLNLHEWLMKCAFGCSVLFLVSYLVYHYQVGSVRYAGDGPLRTVYFAILISHIVLAATVPVLAVLTLHRGLRRRFDEHRRIARWTLPIWLYVSVTGVVIYLMLYGA